MFTVAALSAAVYAAGALKDLVVAARFGTSDAIDAFLVALLLAILVTNTFTTALGDAFLPVFVRVRARDGTDAARRLVQSAMLLDLALLLVLCVVLLLARTSVFAMLGPGFDGAKRALAESLFVVLIPWLLLGGLVAPWPSILYASGRYAAAALAPAITPVVTISLLVLGGPDAGVIVLALSVVCGKCIEIAWLAFQLKDTGFAVWPAWRATADQLRPILSQAAPLIAAGFLATGSTVVDQAMASVLGSGAVASLTFAGRVPAVVIGIGGLAMSNVLFAQFARLAADGDVVSLRRLAGRYCALAFGVGVVLAGCLIVVSRPLAGLLFERGAFTADDAQLVSQLQMLLLLQVPFHLAGMVLVRVFSVVSRNQLLMVFGAVMLVTNAAANYVLMLFLGLPGIALSTSLVFAVSFGLLCAAAWTALREGGLIHA
jgi:putative peptidoglycan lipid II flippase